MSDTFTALSTLGTNNTKDSYSEFYNTKDGKAVYREYESLEGTEIKKYVLNFIKVLDQAILYNNKHLMTKEQVKYFERYCTEADSSVSDEMQQLDTFLGNYLGE